MSLNVVILAAGKGTRMRSSMAKVMHPIAHKPMVAHVVDTARRLNPTRLCVVYGHGGDQVKAHFADDSDIQWREQTEQLGTGHAVQQALPELESDATCLILYGDVPLIQAATLEQLVSGHSENAIGLLTTFMDDPTGYGRIVKNDQGNVVAIVEEKDADEAQKQIKEVNTGILAVPGKLLREWLPTLSNQNAQGEYYLTDVIGIAAEQGIPIHTHQPASQVEVEGVNNRLQLAALERAYQRRIADRLLTEGVTLRDPNRLDVRGELQAGEDCEIDINVLFEGQVQLGNNVVIGANCVLKNCAIGDGTLVKPNTLIEGAKIANHCEVGPFARIRPDTVMLEGSRVGNFVETKKTTLGLGSKANHLTYLGDAEIGNQVNVGAGTITCNYDGVNKHKTIIGDGAFIGSNSSLVAPVEVGKNATVGAGSTISKQAPAEQLTLTRAKQITITGWKRPTKKES